MRIWHRRTALALVFSVGTVLVGCSRSPRANFYTLAPAARSETVVPAQNASTVSVAPVTLPELVDRPQLVMYIDDSRVDILEMHRWAEPLKSAIPRLLAENLSRLLGTERVSTYLQNAASEAAYRVFVDIRRFSSTGDSVIVEANWAIRRSKEGAEKVGHSEMREACWAGGYEALTAAYSRALAALSNDIAQSIRTEWAASH